jgi:hypothetical protein
MVAVTPGDALRATAALAELALLAFALIRFRRALRAYRKERQTGRDPLRAVRAAAAAVAGDNRLVQILAFELAMLRYLFPAGRELSEGGTAFSYHRRSGYGQFLAGLGMVAAMELALVHWLVHEFWSPAGAWVLTGLGLYGCLYFFADWLAGRHRPIRLSTGALEVNIGLRWDVEIPYHRILVVRQIGKMEKMAGAGALKALQHGRPSLVLELAEEVVAVGAYGRRRKADRIYLQVDDRQAFEAALVSRLENVR